LRGSDAQQPRKADPRYGAALIKPMINAPPVVYLSRPKYCGNDKFAPLEPVGSQSTASKETPEFQENRLDEYLTMAKKENSPV
jgi:hypothetical protein